MQKQIAFKYKSKTGVEVGSRGRKEGGRAVERKMQVIKVVIKEKESVETSAGTMSNFLLRLSILLAVQ